MIGDAVGVIASLAGDGVGMAMESWKLITNFFFEKKGKQFVIKSISNKLY